MKKNINQPKCCHESSKRIINGEEIIYCKICGGIFKEVKVVDGIGVVDRSPPFFIKEVINDEIDRLHTKGIVGAGDPVGNLIEIIKLVIELKELTNPNNKESDE